MHRDTHVVNHIDDIFDLLGVDYIVRQMIIDLGVGQVALLLAAGNQILKLSYLLVAGHHRTFVAQGAWPSMLKMQTNNYTALTESNPDLSRSFRGRGGAP